MKILITDLHCASNRGDAAILLGLAAILGRQFPDAEISTLTEYPEAAELLCGLPASKQKVPYVRLISLKKNAILCFALLAALLSRFSLSLPGRNFVWKRLGYLPYLEADLVVSTGGSHINDFYAPASSGRLCGLLFATLIGRPVVLLCQSMGPFNNTALRCLTRAVLNRVDLITTRDRKSETTLSSIGVRRPKIVCTADAAFALSDKFAGKLRRGEIFPSIPDGSLKVSISVRDWRHYENPEGHRKYMEAMSSIADWLIESKGALVVFLSTCTGFANYHKDDRITAAQVVSQMRCTSPGNPLILLNEYTPLELRDLYSRMDLHIGTRMHSNILAMLAGTPVVALQYEFKTGELMQSIGLEELLLDVNSLTFESLKRCVETALSQRKELAHRIREEVEKLRARAFDNAILVGEVVQRRLKSRVA